MNNKGKLLINVGLLLSSILAFLIILGCLFYNSLLIDMNKLKDYITESNIILEQVDKNEEKINKNKGEYISRLLSIKRGMESAHTSILFEKYKLLKIDSIELLIDTINEENDDDKSEYLRLVFNCNNESQEELDTLMNKNFLEVTYLCIKSYISV
ncbi:MAG: hypothetical protein RSD36_07210 [Terrisporobacter sp.]